MKKCPVCEKSLADTVCQNCGYDASLDYENYPTLMNIPLRNKDNKKLCQSSGFQVDGDRLVKYCGTSPYPRVPNGIRIIDQQAFADNKAIKTVTLPDSVTEIREKAFYFCSNLHTINFPPNLEIIGANAFVYSGLTAATLPDSLRLLGEAAFSGTKIERVRIPSKVTAIQKDTFRFCRSLREVRLCEGVETIDGGSFNLCKNLRMITIPNSLKHVVCLPDRDPPFSGTDNIISVIAGEDWKVKNKQILRIMIPSSNEAENFLMQGSVLVRYYGRAVRPSIPEGVTEIGKAAFFSNSHVQSIIIPEGVRVIGERAFAGCNNLTKVYMPQSLVRIGEKAFASTGLTFVEIPKNVYGIGMRAFINCNQLKEVTIPEGLMNIPISAFAYCQKLKIINASEAWKKKHSDLISAVLENKTEEIHQWPNVRYVKTI